MTSELTFIVGEGFLLSMSSTTAKKSGEEGKIYPIHHRNTHTHHTPRGGGDRGAGNKGTFTHTHIPEGGGGAKESLLHTPTHPHRGMHTCWCAHKRLHTHTHTHTSLGVGVGPKSHFYTPPLRGEGDKQSLLHTHTHTNTHGDRHSHKHVRT